MIVHLCGSSSSGKTTLAAWIAEEYGLKVLPSAARQAFARTGFLTFANLLADKAEFDLFQDDLLKTQLDMEIVAGDDYVCDRFVDQFVYRALYGSGRDVMASHLGEAYMTRAVGRSSGGGVLVFHVRPTPECYASGRASGDRTEFLKWDELQRFDGALEFLLKSNGIPHRVIDVADATARKSIVRDAIREVFAPRAAG